MAGNQSPPSDIQNVFSPPFRAQLSVLNPGSPSIRQSLSRSPSKTPRRLIASRSASPRVNAPLSPICGSPTERSRSTSLLPTIKRNVQNCFGTPRANRKRTSHMFVWEAKSEESAACREKRQGPLERTLSEKTDNGNATPHSSGSCSDDIENQSKLAMNQDDPVLDITTKRKSSELFEGNGHSRAAMERLEKGGSLGRFAAKSSPLKRSDGFMNLDHSYLGSPSAKRRSLHGVHLGSGFNIFDQAAEEEKSQDLGGNGITMDTSSSPDQTTPSHTPRKSSSLRRSMQPRQEKPGFAKSRLHAAVADIPTSPANHSMRDQFRMSLDNHLPPQIPHDSPFSSQGALPSASIHPVSQVQSHVSIFTRSQRGRHPLTRQLSQSSTSSLMTDDSPTHFPAKQADNRRKHNDFARSLPLGSRRPASSDASTQGQSSQGYSVEGSFSTPENYKAARPLAQAFMSTGLISKRHRTQPDTQGDLNAERSIMPDTPCKRQPFTTIPTPALAKDSEAHRHHVSRHSFGTPSTPMHNHTHNINLASLGKNVSIFGSNIKSVAARRSSLFSNDGDGEGTTSPSRTFLRRQVSTDSDLPPTPTRPMQSPWAGKAQSSTMNRGKPMREGQEQTSWLGNKSPNAKFEPTCKLPSPLVVPEEVKDLESNEVQQNPPPALQSRIHFPVPLSLTRSRSARLFQTPAPLQRTSNTFPLLKVNAKSIHLSTASPISELCERLSPRTPQEAHTPPDPSRLSISAVANGEPDFRFGSQARRLSMGPPETPTAVKDSSLNFSIFASSVTPTAASRVAEIDPCLTARFDKVEPLGGGDFSRVYKVSKPKNSTSLIPHFSRSIQQHPQTDPRIVWAVKRSVTPYMGNRDRERRLQEVHALKAMGTSEHIIHLIDHWEEKGHLYIQTEYCEEGTLQGFVNQAGRYARLDDFRIWKILIELASVSTLMHQVSAY